MIALFAAAFAAQARLSETADDCDKRYGKPVLVTQGSGGYTTRYYFKSGWLVSVAVKNNMAAGITYSKLDAGNKFLADTIKDGQWSDIISNVKFFRLDISPIAVQRFLEINAEGKSWRLVITNLWRRDDGVDATLDTTDKTFSVRNKEYIDYITGDEAKELVGF
jgi:hypothetical protein